MRMDVSSEIMEPDRSGITVPSAKRTVNPESYTENSLQEGRGSQDIF